MFQFIFFAIGLRGSEFGFLAMGGRAVLLVCQPPRQPDFFTAQEAKHDVIPGLISIAVYNFPARF
jgi:hypothetical protein